MLQNERVVEACDVIIGWASLIRRGQMKQAEDFCYENAEIVFDALVEPAFRLRFLALSNRLQGSTTKEKSV